MIQWYTFTGRLQRKLKRRQQTNPINSTEFVAVIVFFCFFPAYFYPFLLISMIISLSYNNACGIWESWLAMTLWLRLERFVVVVVSVKQHSPPPVHWPPPVPLSLSTLYCCSLCLIKLHEVTNAERKSEREYGNLTFKIKDMDGWGAVWASSWWDKFNVN